MTEPTLSNTLGAFSNGRGVELQAIDGGGMAVTWDDKGKMILPPAPAPTDIAGLCTWLTIAFALDPQHPITGGERQGRAGPEGHVELRRAGARSIRFEPMSKIHQPPRLIAELGGWLLDTDGAIPAFRAEHCRAIHHVIRMLCGRGSQLSASDEAAGIVGTFLGAAQAGEGLTTHGTTQQRYEAATALQRSLDEDSGRPIGAMRYLIDASTGELVIRVADLAVAARAHAGTGLAHGWLDGRMDALGWVRVRLSGYSQTGRDGRRTGTHVRCDAYRGHLTHEDDSEGSVNT
jgi:hypothetical protein